jgi:outer membrane protein OmpA-like peptidoglycan-associated protein
MKAESMIKVDEMKGMLNKAMDTSNHNAADKTILLDNIYFETGSSKLDVQSEATLDALKEAFDQHPGLKAEIGAHTDNTGDAAANKKLSQERANAVKDYLTNKGIASDRISAIAYGSDKPVDSNESESGRTKNRRIEFKILSF